MPAVCGIRLCSAGLLSSELEDAPAEADRHFRACLYGREGQPLATALELSALRTDGRLRTADARLSGAFTMSAHARGCERSMIGGAHSVTGSAIAEIALACDCVLLEGQPARLHIAALPRTLVRSPKVRPEVRQYVSSQ